MVRGFLVDFWYIKYYSAFMRFDIITIFPEILDSYLDETILARAKSLDLIEIHTHNPRRFAKDAHKSIDDRPYSGGAGMVMMFYPIAETIKKIIADTPNLKRKILLMTPTGTEFSQSQAKSYADDIDQIIFICGRYEGVDARLEEIIDEKISIGPYVLAGGELPALVITEAVSRLVLGVLGKEESLAEESHNKEGYLEYPQYTRPEVVEWEGKKYKVPDTLLSGNHAEIEKWRKDNAKN